MYATALRPRLPCLNSVSQPFALRSCFAAELISIVPVVASNLLVDTGRVYKYSVPSEF